jgi:hypothetical protein
LDIEVVKLLVKPLMKLYQTGPKFQHSSTREGRVVPPSFLFSPSVFFSFLINLLGTKVEEKLIFVVKVTALEKS